MAQFKKGQSGNPSGRPRLPKEVSEARSMAYADMLQTVIDIRRMTPGQAAEVLKTDVINLGERAILKAYMDSNHQEIKVYEDRLFGRATENWVIETEHTVAGLKFSDMTDEQLEAIIAGEHDDDQAETIA